jgi:membrane protein required for colicin V production
VNWLTIVLVLVIGFATYRAWRNGFIRELVSLSAVILGIPIAGLFYDSLFLKMNPIIDNEPLAKLISFIAILVGVIVAGQVAAHLLKRAVAMLNLGMADQLAGAGFGFLKAAIICQVVLIALIRFPSPDVRGTIDDSPVAKRLVDTAPLVLSVLPKGFNEATDAFLAGVENLDGQVNGEQ